MKFKKEVGIAVSLMFVLVCTSFVFAGFIADEDVVASGASTSFSVDSAPQCIEVDDIFYWETYPGGDLDSRVESMEDCRRKDGISGDYGVARKNCCPKDHVCQLKEGEDDDGEDVGKYTCVYMPAVPSISMCEEYETQEDCEGDNLENVKEGLVSTIAENLGIDPDELDGVCEGKEKFETTSDDGKCRYLVGCGCKWNSGENKCDERTNWMDCSDTDPEPTLEECRVSVNNLVDLCSDEGVYEISWSASLVEVDYNGLIQDKLSPEPWCQNGEKTFDCPPSAGLNFFGFFNLLVCVLGIFVIYFVWAGRAGWKRK